MFFYKKVTLINYVLNATLCVLATVIGYTYIEIALQSLRYLLFIASLIQHGLRASSQCLSK